MRTKYKKKYKKNKDSFFKKRFLFIFSLLLITIVCFFSYITFSDFYQLKEIIILGEVLNDKDIKKEIEDSSVFNIFFKSKSLIFLSEKDIENKIINNFPEIEELSIRKIFPNKIKVNLLERKKYADFCDKNEDIYNCYQIDKKGIIFKKSSYNKDSFTIINFLNNQNIYIGEKVIEDDKIYFLIKAKENIENKFGFLVNEATFQFDKSIFLVVDNFEIRLTLEDSLDMQIKRLKLLLEEELKDTSVINYIELRYGSRVFYK